MSSSVSSNVLPHVMCLCFTPLVLLTLAGPSLCRGQISFPGGGDRSVVDNSAAQVKDLKSSSSSTDFPAQTVKVGTTTGFPATGRRSSTVLVNQVGGWGGKYVTLHVRAPGDQMTN